MAPTFSTITHMLDTDILIDVQRNHAPAVAWLAALDLSTIGVSGYASMEMRQSARDKTEATAANSLLGLFHRVWPSRFACEAAHGDYVALHLSHKLGILDALIGATARELGATLCTFNVKHYRLVPGLTIEQPYTR